jgi:hypothetical protein
MAETSNEPTALRAYDELWNIQDAGEVLQRVVSIREALLRQDLVIDDPSEAFLAIQGAALRFHPSQQKETQQHQSQTSRTPNENYLDGDKMKVYWSVTEESLWAIAALACVCVGPAWRSQIHQRRLAIAQQRATREGEHSISSTPPPPPPPPRQSLPGAILNSETNNGNISPVTTNTSYFVNEDAPSDFPSIPEVLPAAMLRFAASSLKLFPYNEAVSSLTVNQKVIWEERTRNIAVAQRYLVLALCCESPNINKDFANTNATQDSDMVSRASSKAPKGTDWTILGANELVGDMVIFWLGLINLAREENTDWWYTLQVTKASTYLVRTGWRPLFKQNIGDSAVKYLLEIAEKGISLLDTRSVLGELSTTKSESRPKEERLAASSSTIEAISTLTVLGSRGLIPLDSQQMTSRKIFRLHVISGLIKASMSGIFPLGVRPKESQTTHQAEASEMERKIFLTQIESCFAKTADFLWILFATKSSSENTIASFLGIINAANLNLPLCPLLATDDWGIAKSLVCMEAGTAIRMISAALWRRGAMSTPYLRDHFCGVLGILREIASSIHSILYCRLQEGEFVSRSTCDMLTLAFDTIVALGNFADRQLIGSIDHVSELEWDIFLVAVEEAFLPWSKYSKFDPNLIALSDSNVDVAEAIPSILKRAYVECESLILRLGACLDKFVRIESSPFHVVVDYESQKRLYRFILRVATPFMEVADAELLGLTTFKAWIKFGRYLFRLSAEELVSEILLEGFSKFENGNYVHSPRVRLASLRALGRTEIRTAKNVHSENGTMDISVLSDGSRISLSSTITTALDRNDSQSEIMNVVIPILKSILIENGPEPIGQYIFSVPTDREKAFKRNEDDLEKFTPDSSFALESHAIELVGILIRRKEYGETRLMLVELLASAGLDSRWKTYVSREQPQDFTSSLYAITRLQHSVSLNAIRELHTCLTASFQDCAFIHGIVPKVVTSLCAILIACTDDPGPNFQDELQYERTILAFVALISLCRLKLIDEGRKITLVPIGQILKLIPDFLYPLLAQKGFNIAKSSLGAQVTEFIYIADADEDTESILDANGKTTMMSFESIVSSITTALGSSRTARDDTKAEICKLLQSLGSFCFHALTEFLLSGFLFSEPVLLEDVIFSSGIACAESSQELLSRSKMLAALTESTVARYISKMSDTADHDELSQKKYVDSLINLLLYVCDSTRLAESIAGCRAVIASLPSLVTIDSSSRNKKVIDIFTRIGNRLQREVVALKRIASVEKESIVTQEITFLLSISHDIMIDAKNSLAPEDLLFCFDLCKEIIQKMLSKPTSFCLYLAIQCLVVAMGRLPEKIIETLNVETLSGDFERIRFESECNISIADDSSIVSYFDLSAEFIGLLVSELSSKRLRAIRESEGEAANPNEHFPVIAESYHEDLALELENMERFQVEDGEKGPQKGIWLCGDCLLLTIYVGSSKSRYRGWVQIVLRSPTFRKRLMVRLLSEFSVKNPDVPSMLWADKKNSNRDSGESKSANFASSDETVDLLSKYKSLVQRFDSLIPPSSHYQDDQTLVASVTEITSQMSKDTDSMFSSFSHDTSCVTESSNAEPSNTNMNIIEWLYTALGSNSSVNDVKLALQNKLYLPESLILDSRMPEEGDEVVSMYGRNLAPVRELKIGPRLDRAISILDRTASANTHKLAILYAGPTESSERDPEAILLSVKHCSPTFYRFAEGLGNMVPTKQLRYFSGGLDVSDYESDGRYTRVWIGNEDSSLPAAKSIVVYHIAHLMPPGINNRKRHVGNDNVLIIYLENDPSNAVNIDISEDEVKDSVVSGHFGFVTIYVSVVSSRKDLTRVTVPIRDGLPDPLRKELQNFAGTDIIATRDAPAYVRAIAIRLDLACRSVHNNLAPASNCYERYRMLREMKRYCLDGSRKNKSPG